MKNKFRYLGIFLVFVFAIFVINSAEAKTYKVQAIDAFDTSNPSETFRFHNVNNVILKNGDVIPEYSTVYSSIFKVKPQKRFKRNASFVIKVDKIVTPLGNTIELSDVYARYTTKFDAIDTTKSAALSVGNHFVKGISVGYKTVEGIVENKEGNRVKSGAMALYNATPISYVEKGQAIVIQEKQEFLLEFGVVSEEHEKIIHKIKYGVKKEKKKKEKNNK